MAVVLAPCYGVRSAEKETPRRSGAKVVEMGCVSRHAQNFERSRTRTVSPWSRRAADISRSEPCPPDTCQSEPCQPEAPEAAAPCEADRRRRQHSASPRMQPLQLESSACLAP